MDRWSWQQCQCVDGFTGRFCEKCKLRPPAAPPLPIPSRTSGGPLLPVASLPVGVSSGLGGVKGHGRLP